MPICGWKVFFPYFSWGSSGLPWAAMEMVQPSDNPGTKRQIGSAIRPKNSRPVAPPGFMLHAAADFSGLDVQIFYNLDSYDSPESPL